jgi:hypothetical protein
LQDDDDGVGGRVALATDENAHTRVKLLQGVAKIGLKVLIDYCAGCDMPEAGELLL